MLSLGPVFSIFWIYCELLAKTQENHKLFEELFEIYMGVSGRTLTEKASSVPLSVSSMLAGEECNNELSTLATGLLMCP
jgi:hypothetical protein